MTQLALLFPGQGAQTPGMGKEMYDAFPIVRQRFEEAEEYLKRPLRKECFEGPDSLLKRTDHAQVALFTVGAALFDLLLSQSPSFSYDYGLGLSLGEYTALYALRAISFEEGLRLVALRGQLMQEACQQTQGAMAAVLGLSKEHVEESVKEAALPNDVWVANLNSPAQIVISGTPKGIAAATHFLQESGAKRVIPLDVEGAFHSGLMKKVEAPLRSAIFSSTWQKPQKPLVMNLTASTTDSIDEIKDGLVCQVTHPVRWQESIETLHKKGVRHFLEFGPGKTLSALNKRISPELITLSLDKPSDLEALQNL